MNAYAAAYTDPTRRRDHLLRLERNANTGDATSASGSCRTGGLRVAGGSHRLHRGTTDGDLLIVSAFTGGGTVSTINVYRWNGDANGVPANWDNDPVASGVDCRTRLPAPRRSGLRGRQHGAITTPWLTAAKTNRRRPHPPGRAVLRGRREPDPADLAGKCFNTFIGDTRSSTSLTATLFDFSGGTLGECTRRR